MPPARDTKAILAEYRSKGLARRVGFGERPAVLVVDLIVGFTDPESPLGSDLDATVTATRRLLDAARSGRLPVLFTTTLYDDPDRDGGLFVRKVPSLALLRRDTHWVEVDPRLAREPDEPLLEKRFASAFFGTTLAADLAQRRVDTILLTGCTTSGCIRATAVDALQHGLRAIVPRECVGDRAPEPHVANLLDIDGKYGDVTDLAAVLEYVGEVAP